MNIFKKNNKSLLQKFIDLIARIFSIRRRKDKEEKGKTDDIYPLW